MDAINWIGVFFAFGIPAGIIVGMAAVLIRDHIKKKRRDRRCHRAIDEWWTLRAE